MMTVWFGKKYHLELTEHWFQDILIDRKCNKDRQSPTVKLVRMGFEDKYKLITTESPSKTTVIEFTPNVEFDESAPNGRTYKSTMVFDGEKTLIHVQLGEIPSTMYLQFSERTLVTTKLFENGEKMIQWFKVYDPLTDYRDASHSPREYSILDQ